MSDESPQTPLSASKWALLLAGYWLALLVGTHLPPTFRGLPPSRIDKLVHFTAYAVLAWLLATAWQHSVGRLNGRHLRFAWLAIVAFAIVDELTQLLVGRTAEVVDWMADAAGAAVGLIIFWWWQQRNR